MNMRKLSLIVVILASSSLSAAEPGTQLEWSATTAVGHTDNVTLVESDPISQTIASAGGSINLTRTGSRLNATLRGDGNFLSYLDDAFEDEFLGSAAANIEVDLVGEALTWTVDNTFGQAITNEFEPPTPDNRGNVNVISTGPDILLPIGSATELAFGGRYEDSTYESTSETDSQSWLGNAAIVRRASPAVAWSLNAAASHVNYDDTASSSFNEQEAFARLDARGGRQTLAIDLGIAILDQGDESESTPLVRINWMRELTPSWSLVFYGGSEYMNSADQFVAGVAEAPGGDQLGGTQDVILTVQAHRNDFAGISLAFERQRTTLRLYSSASQERYPDSASLNRDIWSVGAEASRQITQRLNAHIQTSYDNRDNINSNTDDNTTILTARLDWRLGTALFLGLDGGIKDRSGKTTSAYDETVFRISLTYRPSMP